MKNRRLEHVLQEVNVANTADLPQCGMKDAILTFRLCWFCRSGDDVESLQQDNPVEGWKTERGRTCNPCSNRGETFQSLNTRS